MLGASQDNLPDADISASDDEIYSGTVGIRYIGLKERAISPYILRYL